MPPHEGPVDRAPGVFPVDRFTSDFHRVRVVFGDGSITRIGAELDALGVRRPLLITTAGRSSTLAVVRDALADRLTDAYDGAMPHVSVELVREGLERVDRMAPDVLVTVGGGSPLGLAKAIARERTIPIVAVPTTYAGSEMTSIWGITEGDRKRTGRTPAVAPRVVIYDPLLTLGLPADVSAASGMNAIAHAVEALYSAEVGPVAAGAAEDALRALRLALPVVVLRPDDRDARRLALRGAYAAGVALELSTMGLHHKLCHVLGGTFGLPHAPTHAALLPHVVAFNAPAAPTAMQRIAAALGSDNAADGLFALTRRLGITGSLHALGLREGDIERAAELVTSSAYANPRPATRNEVSDSLRAAL